MNTPTIYTHTPPGEARPLPALGEIAVDMGGGRTAFLAAPPPHDPLAVPAVVRLPLTPEQADILAGGEWFVCIGRGHYPHGPEMALLCLPVDKPTADAASLVAMGTHRATRIRKPATD